MSDISLEQRHITVWIKKGFIVTEANSRYLWRLKTSMQENKTRYFVYIWISLWKIVLFFALFVGLDAAFYSVPTSNQNRAADLFKDFDFSGTGYRR